VSWLQGAILAPPRGGRKSLNGDPQWEKICSPIAVPQANVDSMRSLSFKDPIAWAIGISPEVKDTLTKYEEGGGGWSLTCPVAGTVSKITGDIVWRLGCKCRNAFKCPAAAMLVFRKAAVTLHVEAAKGWLHKHTGSVLTQKGLPPNVKVVVEDIVSKNPGIKLKALKNQLWEVHHVSKADFDDKVSAYFYRGCTSRRSSMDVSSGISSYGTVHAFADGNLLFDCIAKHTPGVNTSYLDVAGVIGYYTDVPNNECYVLFSTARLLLDGFLQSCFGFSKGQLHVDFTFKLLQEQIPFFVSSVPDIGQHVHPVSMGPCTHQTAEMVARMLKDQKVITERLVGMLASNEGWPTDWPFAARDAIYSAYATHVRGGLVERGVLAHSNADLDDGAELYLLDHVMADAADALGHAARTVFGDDLFVLMCWVHVWRAVKAKHHLLKTNTEQRQKELYSDILFIHNVTVRALVPIALKRFYAKWIAKDEKPMATYIEKEWGMRKWMRAFTAPGEPGDNNTLESLNRVLKTDSAFGKTTSLGLCLTSCITTVQRLSRDIKPFASLDAPVVSKDQWVNGQKLYEKEHFKLVYKMGDASIVPSEALVAKLPGTTVADRRTNMHVWVKEYISMMKNPESYYKVHGDNGWDFDTLMDYMHSFYVVERIPVTHRHMTALAKVGVIYKCNCPQFMHYHVCKHVIGVALETGTPAPAAFSTAIVGKRAAPAGAKLTKRAKCLSIA